MACPYVNEDVPSPILKDRCACQRHALQQMQPDRLCVSLDSKSTDKLVPQISSFGDAKGTLMVCVLNSAMLACKDGERP